jgi:drug/metabolite transporter (DMT)-like permease
MSPERGDRWIHLSLALLVVAWGAAYPIVKYMLDWLSPLELVLARFWIILPPLAVMAWRWRGDFIPQLREHPGRSLTLALLGVPAYHLFLNYGTDILKTDPLSAGSAAMVSSILVASVPAWTALFARLAGQEGLNRRQWLGQVISLVGVAVIATRGDFTSLRFHPGALIVLGAPLSWGLYSVVAKRIFDGMGSSLPITVFTLVGGTLITSLFTPQPIFGHLAAMPPLAWLALLFIGLISTLAGYLIWSVAVRRLGANRPSTYIYFIPLVSLSMSALLLGERVGLSTTLGGTMILAGVFLIRR